MENVVALSATPRPGDTAPNPPHSVTAPQPERCAGHTDVGGGGEIKERTSRRRRRRGSSGPSNPSGHDATLLQCKPRRRDQELATTPPPNLTSSPPRSGAMSHRTFSWWRWAHDRPQKVPTSAVVRRMWKYFLGHRHVAKPASLHAMRRSPLTRSV